MTRYRVCSTIGCPELVTDKEPCPKHGRPRNARWSKDRDGAAQNRFTRAAIKAHPYCTVCGTTKKLDVHHGQNGEPVVLCNAHHIAVDPHARAR